MMEHLWSYVVNTQMLIKTLSPDDTVTSITVGTANCDTAYFLHHSLPAPS